MRPTASAGKVMVTDARGRMLYVNNEMREMLGYPGQVRVCRRACVCVMFADAQFVEVLYGNDDVRETLGYPLQIHVNPATFETLYNLM